MKGFLFFKHEPNGSWKFTTAVGTAVGQQLGIYKTLLAFALLKTAKGKQEVSGVASGPRLFQTRRRPGAFRRWTIKSNT